MKKENYSFNTGAKTYLFSIIGMILASLLFTNIVFLVSQSFGVSVEEAQQLNWVLFLNIFLSEIVFFATFLVVALFNKKTVNIFKATSLNFKIDVRILFITILMSLICFFSSINMTGLVNYGFSFVSSIELTNSLGVTLNNFGDFILTVLLLAVLPAICEELIFRGVIFNSLKQRFSAKTAVIISSIMFALIHFSIYKTFFQLILGIMLGFLVSLTGTLIYGVVFHFINNFSIVLMNYLFAGKPVLEFQNWGVKEVILSILIFIIGFSIIFFLFKLIRNLIKKNDKIVNLENEIKEKEIEKTKDKKDANKQLLINNKLSSNENLSIFYLSLSFATLIWIVCSFGGAV